jgi:uncharacterized protein YPO0396
VKIIKKLLLIHWHYFSHQLIELENLNFLTGKNASGKSTIIDALQLLLLGDTSGSFFNKAANGKGNRSLKGYLLGELGDDEASGFNYIRGNSRFSSYVVIEVYDYEKETAFTAGCCFDVYSENDWKNYKFFLFDEEFPVNEFLLGKTPMSIDDLRKYLKDNYSIGHYDMPETGKRFRELLYGKLGGLRPERFPSLLKKAVSFNPNDDIEQFIAEFVCDKQQEVNIIPMQENIRSYKQLEVEASSLENRIALLKKIVDKHGAWKKNADDETLYHYLIERASLEISIAELSSVNQTSEELSAQLQQLLRGIERETKQLEDARAEKSAFELKLSQNDQALSLKEMEYQIADLKVKIHRIKSEYEKVIAAVTLFISGWNKGVDSLCKVLDENAVFPDDASLSSLLGDTISLAADLSEFLSTFDVDNISAAVLGELCKKAVNLKNHAIVIFAKLEDKQKVLSKQKAELEDEEKSLENGIYKFPQYVIDLKTAIQSRLRVFAKQDVDVFVLAEISEIKNARWRGVIEGYLSSQKYYLIVPEEYYKEAMGVFDSLKSQNQMYRNGIIDTAKLIRKNYIADNGSLADEICTTHTGARAYLNYLLGRVIKCENRFDMRSFHTAVTNEGLLYKNFVLTSMNPKTMAETTIGGNAIKLKLEAVKKQITEITHQIVILAGIKSAHNEIKALHSEIDINRAVEALRDASSLAELEQTLSEKQKSYDAIDRSEIEELNKNIGRLEKKIGELNAQKDEYLTTKGKIENQLNHIADYDIPRISADIKGKENSIGEIFAVDWIETVGCIRYERELSDRGNPTAIKVAFPRERSRAENARNAAWEDLVELRHSYNDKFKMGLDYKTEDNSEFENLWIELSENQLPGYAQRISDARESAMEEFRENCLSRLQHNIENAENQLKDLNVALRSCQFGDDTYKFKASPKPDYKQFYDMIMDPMITEGGWTLYSQMFFDKYKAEVDELFSILTNDSGSLDVSDYERRVQDYTDYRTYLSFDLEVTNKEGESQRLSKTMGKKSGGETQTPFYIAVLASFAQLYRIQDKAKNTARIIIFDEAFSKMDGERIIKSIELLRKFKFQVLLSAPPDKIGDIATLVDRNLCVIREGKQTRVVPFDPRHMEDLIDGEY